MCIFCEKIFLILIFPVNDRNKMCDAKEGKIKKRNTQKGIEMNINGVNYDSYLASIAQAQAISTQQTAAQVSKTESDRDSYISGIANAETAIPSGIYGADGLEVGDVGTDGSATSGEAASGGAGGVGGGSSDSEEDTETTVVTINGVTYLQTTTTDENGNTTVTRTQIGTADVGNDGKTAGTGSSAAQALASL
jgi:hypothetical protein